MIYSYYIRAYEEKEYNVEGGFSMRIEFIGAAHEVTGSCHYLKIGGKTYSGGLWYGAGGRHLRKSGYSGKCSSD